MGSLCVVIGGNFVSTMCKSMSKGEKDIFSFVLVMNDWAATLCDPTIGSYYRRGEATTGVLTGID